VVVIACRKCRASVVGDTEACPRCGSNPQPVSSRVAHALLSVTLIGVLMLARQVVRLF
jgi:rRNA maturation endonuclease Nob1